MASHWQQNKVAGKQKGLTLVGLIVLLILFGLVLVFIAKLAPIYFESYEVSKTLESLRVDAKSNFHSERELEAMLLKRLSINDVSHVGKDQIRIVYAEQSAAIRIVYEVRTPLIANLALIAAFDKQIDLSLQ